MTGKNDPLRNLGIRSSTSPPLVVSSRSRAPLRSVVRVSLRSYRAAPIRSVASASISSCITIRTDSRTRSTPSPAPNASSSSDRADWGRAIGELLFDVCLAVHTEDLADGPSRTEPAVLPQVPPLHGTPTGEVRPQLTADPIPPGLEGRNRVSDVRPAAGDSDVYTETRAICLGPLQPEHNTAVFEGGVRLSET